MGRDSSPGFDPRRLVTLMRDAIERCRLDLSGCVVLTEAATGAYVVTPVLAAMAGAEHVNAVTRSTRYGSVGQVAAETRSLADLVGVRKRIEILEEKSREVVSAADIVTNSGHVRPIDAAVVGWMKSTAVVSLMYEAWELRPGDVDVAACRRRGIRVVGVNERHPSVDVFSFLGVMAIKLLTDAGVAVHGSHIVLLCDNPFRPFITRGLAAAGAVVESPWDVREAQSPRCDAIVVALRPRPTPVLSAAEATWIAGRWPGAVVAQFWGDLDRRALHAADVPVFPAEGPGRGHMGILPSALGPEPIVRLQAGGLKAAETALGSRPMDPGPLDFAQAV